MRRLLLKAAVCTALIIPAGALGLLGSTAAGANFSCDTFIDFTLISGNLVVPSGAECSISNVTVTGNVVVLAGGGLTMDASTVRGNFTGTTAEYIQVGSGGICCAGVSAKVGLSESSYVYGNATISGTTDTPGYEGFNTFCNTFVGGSLTLQNNLAPFALGDDDACYGNSEQIGNSSPTVGANTLLQSNHASILMEDLRTAKILTCVGNNPPPTDDGGNTAKIAVGQCSTFNSPPT